MPTLKRRYWIRKALMTWVGAATACLSVRAPAAAAAPGGPGGARALLAAALAFAPAGTLAALAGAGATRHVRQQGTTAERSAYTVRYAISALAIGAALLPLSAGTAFVSAAGALLLMKSTIATSDDGILLRTAIGGAVLAAAAPLIHFIATMPGVTADHVRYGLEAPTLLGNPEAWGLRPPWAADTQAASRAASWTTWWTTMRQAAAEAATTDTVLSPASIFSAAAGAAAAARRRDLTKNSTRVASWSWLAAGSVAAATGLAAGWTGIGGRASSWLQGAAGATLAIAAEPAACDLEDDNRDEAAGLPALCAGAAAIAAHLNPLSSPTPLAHSSAAAASRATWAAATGAATALAASTLFERARPAGGASGTTAPTPPSTDTASTT